MASHFTQDQIDEINNVLIPTYLANNGYGYIHDDNLVLACGKRNPDGSVICVDGTSDPDTFSSVKFGDVHNTDGNGNSVTVHFVQGARFEQEMYLGVGHEFHLYGAIRGNYSS